MKILPDLFKPYYGKVEGALGLQYPDCPINEICVYVTSDGELLPTPRCKYFQEPPEKGREPKCLYIEGETMSIDPLYESAEYKRYKAMVDTPLLLDVYDKIAKIEKELYILRMEVSRWIDRHTDDMK